MYDFRRESWGTVCRAWIGLGGKSESGVSNAPVLRRDAAVLLADDLRGPEVAGLLGRTKSGEFSADPDWNTLSSEKCVSASFFTLTHVGGALYLLFRSH